MPIPAPTIQKNGKEILKDFFIPHAGNGYKPWSLDYRRLVFHIITAILIKLIIIIFVLIFPIEAWLTPELMTEQSRKIIALTNEIRQDKKLPALRESESLTQAAYQKAEDMLLSQYFEHVSPKNFDLVYWLKKINYKFTVAGENLAMGFADAADVVNGWVRSKTHYANIVDPDFREVGVGMVSGAFDGQETTLVAQYFGATEEATAEPKKNAATNGRPVKTTAKTAEAKKTTGLVLASAKKNIPEKKEAAALAPIRTDTSSTAPLPDLAAPILVDRAETFAVRDRDLSLKIFAPGAEKIYADIDGDVIILQNITASSAPAGYYNLNLSLANGRHALKIKSARGTEEKLSPKYGIVVDNTPPAVDRPNSTVEMAELSRDSFVISATALLSADTKEAEVSFNNYRIALEPEAGNPNRWSGRQIIFKQNEEQIFNPVILPSLYAADELGNAGTTDLSWLKPTPTKSSLINQYFFFRSHQPAFAKKMFDITSAYYKLLILFLTVAMLLHIFIEIKKQHPHIIASALGVISLLIILVVL